MDFSNAGEIIQDIHIRGIVSGNKNVPLVIIEDPFSGSINTYQLHDKLNDYEIVEIKKKEGILLKYGEKTVWVLLSARDSFWNKDKLEFVEENKNKVRFCTLKKDQIDTEHISIKPGSDDGKRNHGPGVIVTEIKEESFLSVMGMESGDVLLKFNKAKINQAEDLEEAIGKFINAELNDSAGNNLKIAFKKDGKYQTGYAQVK